MTPNPDGATDGGLTFDPDARSYTARRAAGETPSHSVVRTVAAVTGTAPEDVRPLYDAVDPDALDRLFARTESGAERPLTGQVRFRFNRCDVTVHADGRTVVSPDENVG
jgi:hypothetical protein